jgi:hypothetical protein
MIVAKANFFSCFITPDLSLGLITATSNMDFSPQEKVKQ